MNKLIIAAVAAISIFVANAAESNTDAANNWRISVGGTARGSMKAIDGELASRRCEAYGADLDLQYRAFSMGDFSLWAGMGGTYLPKQHWASQSFAEVDTSDPTTTYEGYGSGKLDVAVGEFRLMLVPEYALTESWTVGARIGVAFDWLRAALKTTVGGQITDSVLGGTIPLVLRPRQITLMSSRHRQF